MPTQTFTEVDVLGCYVQPIVPLNVVSVSQLELTKDGRVANNQLFKLFIGGQFALQTELANNLPKITVHLFEGGEIVLETEKAGSSRLFIKCNAQTTDLSEANEWLSDVLGYPCQLRTMETNRVQTLSVVSYGSFMAFNGALITPIAIEKLGANLVIDAPEWAETEWGTEVFINKVQFIVGPAVVHPQIDVVKLNWKEEENLTSAQKLFRPLLLGTDRSLRFGRSVQPVTAGSIVRYTFT